MSTSSGFDLILEHGYAFAFLSIWLEQLGIPLPALPVLLAVGAVAGAGGLNLWILLSLSWMATLAADLIWFELGRLRGGRVLSFLCRVSLEPDSCVRKAEEGFARLGPRTLLVAKYVPGLSTVASPLAGVFGMSRGRFLLYDGAGTFLWATPFVLLGYLFSDAIEDIALWAARLAGGMAAGLVLLLLPYLAWKLWYRYRFMRSLRIARITPDELREKLDQGEPVVVVDLRHPVDFEADPAVLPQALRLTPDEIEARHEEIPRDREVVLYCT